MTILQGFSRDRRLQIIFQIELLDTAENKIIFQKKCMTDFVNSFPTFCSFWKKFISVIIIGLMFISTLFYLSAFVDGAPKSLQVAWVYSLLLFISIDTSAIKAAFVLLREFLIPVLIRSDVIRMRHYLKLLLAKATKVDSTSRRSKTQDRKTAVNTDSSNAFLNLSRNSAKLSLALTEGRLGSDVHRLVRRCAEVHSFEEQARHLSSEEVSNRQPSASLTFLKCTCASLLSQPIWLEELVTMGTAWLMIGGPCSLLLLIVGDNMTLLYLSGGVGVVVFSYRITTEALAYCFDMDKHVRTSTLRDVNHRHDAPLLETKIGEKLLKRDSDLADSSCGGSGSGEQNEDDSDNKLAFRGNNEAIHSIVSGISLVGGDPDFDVLASSAAADDVFLSSSPTSSHLNVDMGLEGHSPTNEIHFSRSNSASEQPKRRVRSGELVKENPIEIDVDELGVDLAHAGGGVNRDYGFCSTAEELKSADLTLDSCADGCYSMESISLSSSFRQQDRSKEGRIRPPVLVDNLIRTLKEENRAIAARLWQSDPVQSSGQRLQSTHRGSPTSTEIISLPHSPLPTSHLSDPSVDEDFLATMESASDGGESSEGSELERDLVDILENHLSDSSDYSTDSDTDEVLLNSISANLKE